MAPRALIIRRLDAALTAMESRGMEVRAIYLTTEDQESYDRAQSKAYGSPVCCLQYSNFEIRRGNSSRVYSTHGVSLNVPKQVPR